MPHALKTTVSKTTVGICLDVTRLNQNNHSVLSATCILHTKQQATINHLFNAVCSIRTFFKCTVTNVALKLQVETSNNTVPQY